MAATARTTGKILVVDDDLVVRDSLSKWFSSEGYIAQPAAGASQALEAIQRDQYDLAVVDIRMLGINGIELQGRLRQICPDLAVIIVTGYPSEPTAAQALKFGAIAYLTKPVDLDELSGMVAEAIEHQQRKKQAMLNGE
ncbi:MAG: response regulator [Bryobacteraceae bacterium]